MFLLFLLYFIIAITFVLAKDAVLSASPLFFIAIRMICAGILLYTIEFSKERKITLPRFADIFVFSLITLLHIYIPFSGEFWALTRVDALKVNFLFSLTPFFAVTIQALLDQKLPRIKTVAGILIGFCALMFLLVIKDQSTKDQYQEIFLSFSVAEFVLLVSVLSSTIAWFIIKRVTEKKYSITTINAWSMLFGGTITLVTAYLFEEIMIHNTFEFFKNLILLILLSNVFFYNLYGSLLKQYSIALLTAAGFLSPLFGMFFESIMTKTMPHHLYFLAFFFVLLGLYFISDEEQP